MSRRRSTVKNPRGTANEYPKTLELEQRLSRLEICCGELQQTLTLLKKQHSALQAQIDYIDARFDRRQH